MVYARPGLSPISALDQPLHLAIGMFDGVHVGHQAVVAQVIRAAAVESGHVSGVLTFDPHPSRVLYPERATSLIMPLEQRIRKMHNLGIDYVFVQPFTQAYATQEAEAFVTGLVKSFSLLKSIHVGENFRYGAGRSGTIDTLERTSAAEGIKLHALKREFLDGMPISSSRIRLALVEGSIEEVGRMLGQPYTIEGRVTPGKGMGRKMKYPTLNIPWVPEVPPRYGVYRVYLKWEGSDEILAGVANYGLRPTVGTSTEPLLEVHLIKPSPMPSEGDSVKVALMQFLRPEMNFSSIEALCDQIALDVEKTRMADERAQNSIPVSF